MVWIALPLETPDEIGPQRIGVRSTIAPHVNMANKLDSAGSDLITICLW